MAGVAAVAVVAFLRFFRMLGQHSHHGIKHIQASCAAIELERKEQGQGLSTIQQKKLCCCEKMAKAKERVFDASA